MDFAHIIGSDNIFCKQHTCSGLQILLKTLFFKNDVMLLVELPGQKIRQAVVHPCDVLGTDACPPFSQRDERSSDWLIEVILGAAFFPTTAHAYCIGLK